MPESRRYVVIGAGAIGGVLAARLAQAGRDVVLVARGEHGRLIADRGLLVRHPHGVDTVPLVVASGVADVTLTDADVLVLAVKTQDAESVLREWAWAPVEGAGAVSVGADLPIVTFQNGLDTERAALRRFSRVYGATIAIAASYLTAGEVVSPSLAPAEGLIWLGRFPGGTDETSAAVVADLAGAGFAAFEVDDVRESASAKLLGNVGNGLDLLAGDDAARDAARGLLRAEASAVLAAAGLPNTPDGSLDFRGVAFGVLGVEGHEGGRLSTWQSFSRGASLETDFLNGEIVLLARLHGTEAPLNERLQRLLGDPAADRTLSALLEAAPVDVARA